MRNRSRFLALLAVGVFLGAVGRADAQDLGGVGVFGGVLGVAPSPTWTPADSAAEASARTANPSLALTVRPRAAATGTRTALAGEVPLDSLPGYVAYVPERCVGTRRCPLVVFLHPAAEDARYVLKRWAPVSDTYGTILLAPSSPGDRWGYLDRDRLDRALTQVLGRFAIDPAQIALIGYSRSGPAALAYGGRRLDLFSRVILGSTDGDDPGSAVDAQDTTTQFLVAFSQEEARSLFRNVRSLRRAGRRVAAVLALRGHASRDEDWDFMGRWLQQSWAIPNPAARPQPLVVVDSLPLLTREALRQMTAFWAWFRQAPDSLRNTARLAHLRQVVVPVATERPAVLMTDLPALAAKYPAVAAALATAGLTAAQHEAYRVALVSAMVADHAMYGVKITSLNDKNGNPRNVPPEIIEQINRENASGPSPISLPTSSVQAKNLEFEREYKDKEEFNALGGLFYNP